MAYEVPDFAAQVSIIASEVTLSVAVSGTANVNISGQSIDVKITNAVDASGAPIPLKIDISAQSLATLAVDIKSQSVGNLGVDIKSQSVGNLKVDIAAQSAGNVAVNIAAQSINVNIVGQGGYFHRTDLVDQLVKSGRLVDAKYVTTTTGAGYRVIYTVPTGYVAYLVSGYLAAQVSSTGALSNPTLEIENPSGTLWYLLTFLISPGGFYQEQFRPATPVPFPEGWKFEVAWDQANIKICAQYFLYLVPVSSLSAAIDPESHLAKLIAGKVKLESPKETQIRCPLGTFINEVKEE